MQYEYCDLYYTINTEDLLLRLFLTGHDPGGIHHRVQESTDLEKYVETDDKDHQRHYPPPHDPLLGRLLMFQLHIDSPYEFVYDAPDGSEYAPYHGTVIIPYW